MPTGLQINNDNGYIQIDDNYSNFMLVNKGIVNISQQGQIDYRGSVTFSDQSNTLILAIGLSSTKTNCIRNNSNNQTTFTIHSDVNSTVDYYLFDINRPIAGNNYGLEVYKADGKIAYSSKNTSMRVVSNGDCPRQTAQPNTEASTSLFQLDQNKTYAYVTSSLSVDIQQIWNPSIGIFIIRSSVFYFYRNSSTFIKSLIGRQNPGGSGGIGGASPSARFGMDAGQYLLLDVTNY